MDTEILRARLFDTVNITLKNSRPKYIGFLTLSERAFAENELKNTDCRISFYGGYPDAERVMLGCFPDWMDSDEFPVKAITFEYRKCDSLSHRDFLGALMSLGIERETVGDILVEPGRAVVFVCDELYSYIKTQIIKIGNVGVAVYDGFEEPLPQGDILAEFTETVSSERIDCVIAALCGFSRTKAAELLNSGLVTVNSVIITKPTRSVAENDVISVRSKGRFIIVSLDGRTKKGRIILKYKKHIGR